jgi:Ca2+:H+ antiporter
MNEPSPPPGLLARALQLSPLYWMLLAVPVAAALEVGHAGPVWTFLACCVAVVPLAGLMGRATENLAETLGPGVGGLLNATFGNAAELILALMMLRHGPDMFPMLKASLTGSIIGNVLLVLGAAVLAGGLYHKKQVFNRTAASMGATMLALACVGLLVPTLYYHVFQAGVALKHWERLTREALSEEIAVVLAAVYVLGLVFSLRTHQHLFAGPEEGLPTTGEGRRPEWGRRRSLLVLVAATAGVAVMSEFLVGSVEPAARAMGLNRVFVGVIVVAVIGNAAEHSTAVLVAVKDKMDLAMTIAVGSSLQIALFVAPVLVFASLLTGATLDLHFSLMEIIALLLTVGVLALVSQDGESHWMEGVMLLAVYLIFALAFYHLPEAAP